MFDCWLSPEGEIVKCSSGWHERTAYEIIKERYIPDDEIRAGLRDAAQYLGQNGWMSYNTRNHEWWCYYYGPDPTQKQIDTIFDLTGEMYERKRWWIYCLFFRNFTCKIINLWYM